MAYSNLLAIAIKTLESSGMKHVKTDATHVFFDIPFGCGVLDNDEAALKRGTLVFKQMTGLGVRVKRLPAN